LASNKARSLDQNIMIGIKSSSLSQEKGVYTGAFSYLKASILALVTTIFAFGSGFFVKNFIQKADFDRNFIVALIGCVILFLVLIALEVVFISRKGFLAFSLLLNSVGLCAGFFNNPNQYLLFIYSLIVSLVIIFIGGFSARRLLDDSLKISFFKVASLCIKFGALALSATIAILFFTFFSSKPLDENNLIMSRDLFQKIVAVTLGPLSEIFGGVNVSKSLRETAIYMVENQLQKDSKSFGGGILPAQKQAIIDKSIADLQSRLSSFLGLQVSVDEKLSQAIYNSLLKKVDSLPLNAKKKIFVLSAAAIFLVLSILFSIIRPIIVIVAFLFYEILIALNFGVVVYETRSKESVVLP